MKNSREKLVEALQNAGMAESQVGSNMEQFDKLGWFYCTLNHTKVLELKQVLRDEQDYYAQPFGEVNGR